MSAVPWLFELGLQMNALATLPVSPAGSGRIYFDDTDKKFKVSEDGGAYTNLVSGGTSGGALPYTVLNASGSTTQTTGTILVDTTSGNVTVTIPDSVSGNNGDILRILKSAGGNSVIVQTTSTQDIGGDATQVITQLDRGITIASREANSEWLIIQDSRFLEGTDEGEFQYWDNTNKTWAGTGSAMTWSSSDDTLTLANIAARFRASNATSTNNPFGSLTNAPNLSNTINMNGVSTTTSGASRMALWGYANCGGGSDNPGSAYGVVGLARNNGPNSASNMYSFGVWAEARGTQNSGAGDKLNYGIWAQASGGDQNWAGWFDNATHVQSLNVGIVVTNISSTLSTRVCGAVKQTAGGITTTLWADPVNGDTVSIRNAGGGADNTIDGNGATIEGGATYTIADGEGITLIYDGVNTEWNIF